jgi:hypothetical protein
MIGGGLICLDVPLWLKNPQKYMKFRWPCITHWHAEEGYDKTGGYKFLLPIETREYNKVTYALSKVGMYFHYMQCLLGCHCGLKK